MTTTTGATKMALSMAAATDDVGRVRTDGSDAPMLLPAATTFAQLPLRAELQRALRRMRFHAPSPVQLRALPLALFGADVIGQAKSGTGKTAVFGLTALEHVLQRSVGSVVPSDPLVLVLAPTREIAMQIDAVLRQLAAESDDVRIVPLIGGLPVAQDQKRLRAGCHIAVGTPGRVRWLIEDGVFRPKSIRLLVFDEVDKLLSGEFVADIDAIVASIPDRRQTLAFSATFTPDQLVHVVRMMRDPQVVRVRGPSDVTVELVSSQEKQLAQWIEREKQHEPELWLRHVRQFYRVVPSSEPGSRSDQLQLKHKLVLLASLLSEIAFHQCIVFCNDKFRAEALATALASQGWPAAAITGAQPQPTRNAVMDQFRAVALRVLVSTDLTARGIDVDQVNFVVNLDLPRDPATYLHRVGRTGRFGGKIRSHAFHGLAVTLLTESEVEGMRLLRRVFKMAVDELPTPAPRDVRSYVVGDAASRLAVRDSATPDEETKKSREETELIADSTDDHEVTTDDDVEEGHEEVEEGEVEEGASDGPADVEEEAGRCPDRADGSGGVPSSTEQADDACTRRRHGVGDASQRQHASVGAVASWEERCYTQWLRLL